jgi:hypothetical protein
VSLLPFRTKRRCNPWSPHRGDEFWGSPPQLRRLGRPPRSRFRPTVDRLEDRLVLSTFTVTNTHDHGPGSLRAAIDAANSHSGADKIVIASGVSGTIRLTSGPLTITDDLKINGPGSGQLAVSGRKVSRVFLIDGGSFGAASEVMIKGLTITDGLATEDASFPASGGGILDLEASLTLEDTVLTANQAPLGGAGAMIYRGALTAKDSTWSSNMIIGGATTTTVGTDTLSQGGSGLDVFASIATTSQCTFTGNTSVPGTEAGAILAESSSSLHVADSEFSGNQSDFGGGIVASDTNVTVDDSSFSGNQSGFGGGAIAIGKSFSTSTPPKLTVTDSSFAGNQAGYSGGAIEALIAQVRIVRCAFSRNQASSTTVSIAQGGAIAAMILPLEPGDAQASLSVADSTFTGNVANGTTIFSTGIGMGGAIWNQTTMTVSRSSFSGNTAIGETGQGGAIADEVGTTVTISGTSFLGNQAQGQNGGLGGAIYDDVLTGLSQAGTITHITHSLFSGNSAQGAGGAIANAVPPQFPFSGSLDISTTTFTSNQALGQGLAFPQGGALFSPSRPLFIAKSTFTTNQAVAANIGSEDAQGGQAGGGAITAYGASVSIEGSTFRSNLAQGGASTFGGGAAAGGALSLGAFFGSSSTPSAIANSSFIGNQAIGGAGGVGIFFPIPSVGGAIANLFGASTLRLNKVKVVGNQAIGGDGAPGTDGNGAQGGGIYNGAIFGTMTISHSQITGNLAQGGRGGDAAQLGGTAGNGADGQGGGIYNLYVLTVTGTRISGNTAIGGTGGTGNVSTGGAGGNGVGGGILATEDPFNPGSASLTIVHCTITGNTAVMGLGGSGFPPGAVGQGLGGGIAILAGTTSIDKKTKVKGNHASTAGDNIYTGP